MCKSHSTSSCISALLYENLSVTGLGVAVGGYCAGWYADGLGAGVCQKAGVVGCGVI